MAKPGSHYVVFQPGSWRFLVDLRDAPGTCTATWIHPETGEESPGYPVEGGRVVHVVPPSERSWLILLTRDHTAEPEGPAG